MTIRLPIVLHKAVAEVSQIRNLWPREAMRGWTIHQRSDRRLQSACVIVYPSDYLSVYLSISLSICLSDLHGAANDSEMKFSWTWEGWVLWAHPLNYFFEPGLFGRSYDPQTNPLLNSITGDDAIQSASKPPQTFFTISQPNLNQPQPNPTNVQPTSKNMLILLHTST